MTTISIILMILFIGFVICILFISHKAKPTLKPFIPGIKGILTLNPVPNVDKLIDMGFNILLAYGRTVQSHKNLIQNFAKLGGKLILRTDTPKAWMKDVTEEAVIGYMLVSEEPNSKGITVSDIRTQLTEWKQKGKPVGCEFDAPTELTQEWLDFINNECDFVMFSVYAWGQGVQAKYGKTPEEILQIWRNEFLRDIRVPVLPIIQAIFGDYGWTHFDMPDVEYQTKFWEDTGYLAYTWDDGKNSGVRYDNRWREVLRG